MNHLYGHKVLRVVAVCLPLMASWAARPLQAEQLQVGSLLFQADRRVEVDASRIRMEGNVRVGAAPGAFLPVWLGAASTVVVVPADQRVEETTYEAETRVFVGPTYYPIATTGLQCDPVQGTISWQGTMLMPPMSPASLLTQFRGAMTLNVNTRLLTMHAVLEDPLWDLSTTALDLQLDITNWANSYIEVRHYIGRDICVNNWFTLSADARAVLRLNPVDGVYELGFDIGGVELLVPALEGITLSLVGVPPPVPEKVWLKVDVPNHVIEPSARWGIKVLGVNLTCEPGLRIRWDPWEIMGECSLDIELLDVINLEDVGLVRFSLNVEQKRFEFLSQVRLKVGNFFEVVPYLGEGYIQLFDVSGQPRPVVWVHGALDSLPGGLLNPLGDTHTEVELMADTVAGTLTGTFEDSFTIFGFPILAGGARFAVDADGVHTSTQIQLLGHGVAVDAAFEPLGMRGTITSGFSVGPFWVPVGSAFLANADGTTITISVAGRPAFSVRIKPDGTWDLIWGEPAAAAIHKGINWLRAHQLSNGSWSNEPAVTSLAITAMLNAGYKTSHDDVMAGIQYLSARVNPDGSVHNISNRYTYYTSIAMLPFAATHSAQHHGLLERMRSWLINSQWDESCYYGSVGPSHSYYGGFGYGNSSRPDLSNTQWALMGLKAADDEIGLSAGDTYTKALTFLARCQKADGGSGYTPGEASIHTMTAASVWSYTLCGIGAGDSRVSRGLQWLTDRYSLTSNDGWGAVSDYYYAVTFAKALVMSHKSRLGNHEWFSDLAGVLVNRQTSEGNWPATGWLGMTQADAELNTGYSLLALQTRILPVGADLSMSIILASHADLHVYDPQGRHVGVNYGTMTIDLEIPGATFKVLDVDGNEVPYDGRTPGEGLRQVVVVPQLVAGSYRMEVVGTSDGPFELTINGMRDGEIVTSNSYASNIVTGQRLATSTTVTAMEGALTLLYEPLVTLPTLGVSPGACEVRVQPGSSAHVLLSVTEQGGEQGLHSVTLHCSRIEGAFGYIEGSEVSFDINDFDIPAGGSRSVSCTIPVPAHFAGQASGFIIIESADGGTKRVSLTLRTNAPPEPSAGGPYTTECAGTVTMISLDGSGSHDPDGDSLTYSWTTDCPGGRFDDPNSVSPLLSVDSSSAACEVTCDATLTVSDGVNPAVVISTTVTISDTTAPGITCPADVTITCGQPTDPDATGRPIVTDACDTAPAVTYGDVITPTTCLADPVMYRIARTWTATDACGKSSSCVQTITVLKVVASLDIKPASCPNSFNRGSHGVLPVGLLGTSGFDVATVDLASVRLCRADCAAGSIAPHEGPPGPHSEISDVGTPYTGQACGCTDANGDGIPDLMMHFKTDDLVPALELGSLLPGALVELAVTGKLANGCDFIAKDCIRLVPPDAPPVNLVVRSSTRGAWFDVSPLDLQLDGGGFAVPEFARTFPATSVVTLTAAPSARGRAFLGWRLNDGGLSSTAESVSLTMAGGQTVEAVYRAAGDVDADGDVDMGDFLRWQDCFSGPNRPPAAAGCQEADFDGDADVDLTDFAVFQACFNGPNRSAACK